MGDSLNIPTLRHLALILDTSLPVLTDVAYNMTDHVSPFDLPKKSGGTRRIYSPSEELKRIQGRILRRLLQPIDLPDALHGSVPGRSATTNAQPHVGKPMVVGIDIKDFYPSVHYSRVGSLFERLGCHPDVSRLLTKLTTYEHHLAQGFATSSAIANLILAPIVPRLGGLCLQHGCDVTLYQDDLTVSGDRYIAGLIPLLIRIFREAGFQIHPDKIKVMSREEHQEVTGWSVNRKVNTPREEYRQLRATLHNCSINGIEAVADRPVSKFKNHLRGRIQRVNEVNPDRGRKLLREFETL